MRRYLVHGLPVLLILSCQPSGQFNGRTQKQAIIKTEPASEDVAEHGTETDPVTIIETASITTTETPNATSESPIVPVVIPPPDRRTLAEIICQEGLRIVNAAKKDNFSGLFGVICVDGHTNETFNTLLSTAYVGVNEPLITVIENTTSPLFINRLLFAYAVKVPKPTPAAVQDLNIYSKIGQSLFNDTSKITLSVESKKPFPGKGSVEELVLHYDLSKAMLAGLYDHRRTEVNTYLLKEDLKDAMIVTEHLLDPEHTEFYQVSRGIQVVVKAADGSGTTLIYVNELVVKNRFDPKRVTGTILDLSKVVMKSIYGAAAN